VKILFPPFLKGGQGGCGITSINPPKIPLFQRGTLCTPDFEGTYSSITNFCYQIPDVMRRPKFFD
jgi:hypothetical protein